MCTDSQESLDGILLMRFPSLASVALTTTACTIAADSFALQHRICSRTFERLQMCFTDCVAFHMHPVSPPRLSAHIDAEDGSAVTFLEGSKDYVDGQLTILHNSFQGMKY